MSDPITVPVPEPSTLALFGVALVLCGTVYFVLQRRRATAHAELAGRWIRYSSILLVLCLASCREASAGSVTYTDGLWYDYFPMSLTVPQWDQAAYPGYTLTGVTVDFSFEGTTSGITQQGVFEAYGIATLTLWNSQQLVATSPTEYASAEEVPNQEDYFLSVFLQASISQTYSDPLDLAAVIGDGGISMPWTVWINSSALPAQGSSLFEGGVSVEVTYEWTAVPEPSTALLGIIGLLVVSIVGRRSWHHRFGR